MMGGGTRASPHPKSPNGPYSYINICMKCLVYLIQTQTISGQYICLICNFRLQQMEKYYFF
jgi:hypothetical protein